MDLRTPNHEAIAAANDDFRKRVLNAPQTDGRAVMTRGIAAFPTEDIQLIYFNVDNFSSFDSEDGNDPYGEHDFGHSSSKVKMCSGR